jgi:hypothetical protein
MRYSETATNGPCLWIHNEFIPTNATPIFSGFSNDRRHGGDLRFHGESILRRAVGAKAEGPFTEKLNLFA